MLLTKNKRNNSSKGAGNRFLINVTVVGSAGPIRFIVNEEQLVAAVVKTALKAYAREGRLPVLGTKYNDFVLHCPVVGIEAMKPWDTIGSIGVRNFVLCKKRRAVVDELYVKPVAKKSSRSWKALFNKSFSVKVSSH